MRRWSKWIVIAALVAGSVGCGDKFEPAEHRRGSSVGAATYGQDVALLMGTHCNRCHSTALVGSDRQGAPFGIDMETYEGAVRHAERSNVRIQSNTMPPDGRVSSAEKQAFQSWIDGGFQR